MVLMLFFNRNTNALSKRRETYIKMALLALMVGLPGFLNDGLSAQDVRVSPVLDRTAAASTTLLPGADTDSFWAVRLENGVFESAEPLLRFEHALDYDISPDGRHIAILRETDAQSGSYTTELYNREGVNVAKYSDFDDLDPHDPSLKLYVLQEAGLVLRDNIVSFALYTHQDGFVDRLSNASGSSEGETMSRLATSPDGSAVYVFNPRIMQQGGGYDSRIMRLDTSGELTQVFYQQGAEITHLFPSDDGAHVFAVFVDTGGETSVQKINAEGDVVAEHRSEELSTPDAYVQPDINAVTWFEENQARTYDMETGERLALAFLRGENIIFATYSPEDEAVITLTGRRNNSDGQLHVSSVRVVDLDARSILASSDMNHEMSFQNQDDPRLIRLAARHFRLTGVSNAVDIRF